MKGLSTLTRLSRLKLDQQRQEMARIEDRIAGVEFRINQTTEKAQIAYHRFTELSIPYDGLSYFIEKNKKEQKLLSSQLQSLHIQHSRQHTLVRDSFSELKKYEITADAIIQSKQNEFKKREQLHLDEIGIQKYSRNKDKFSS